MSDRVLVVDDDDAILRLVCPLLEAEELETECVKSGLEAIDRLEHERFAVVLLDLRMPAGDGFSVIEHLERSNLEVPPIVLVVSAYADDRLERDLATGIVTGVIRKPFDPMNLGEIVRRYASKYERHRRRAAANPST
jgi:CheY-like chemotaxis protein